MPPFAAEAIGYDRSGKYQRALEDRLIAAKESKDPYQIAESMAMLAIAPHNLDLDKEQKLKMMDEALAIAIQHGYQDLIRKLSAIKAMSGLMR